MWKWYLSILGVTTLLVLIIPHRPGRIIGIPISITIRIFRGAAVMAYVIYRRFNNRETDRIPATHTILDADTEDDEETKES